ncbi:MAG: hypothetical protein IJZ16_04710 [Clostridia bacterium]|nr:hypothetical protein [Clostridia bacterium]
MSTKEKVYATGYKAYKKGLICDPTGYKPTQFEEGKTYEVENALPCASGFHFCKAPLDVLDYYPLIDNDGNMSEFTTVEALDEAKTDDNKKYCTKKIRIGAKLDFPALIKASIDFAFEQTGSKTKESDKDNEKIKSSGNYAKIGSSGNSAQIGSSGDYAKIGSSGNSAQIGSSGDYAQIGSSGNSAQIVSEGKHSVVCCAGHNSIAKAKIGSWITLSEWKFDENENAYIPICVKTKQVDGVEIKADTFYRLINGEFVEQ